MSSSPHSQDIENFCLKLPKIELHAHINSSVSEKTFRELLRKKDVGDGQLASVESSVFGPKETTFKAFDDCFDIFPLIHKVIDSPEAIYKVTSDVIAEFEADQVKYLELRTTPREELLTGMTRRSYVQTVLSAIKDSKKKNLDIDVRLLLSIDRKSTVQVAWETVFMASELAADSDRIVIGIDFSGNPKINDAKDFIPVLAHAKSSGLKISVHLAEIVNPLESHQLVEIVPDRIGHGTYLHPEVGGLQESVEFVKKHKIPIECCISSNLRSLSVAKLKSHHFGYWYKQSHPAVLATDGKGVFQCSLSGEYILAAKAFQLGQEELWQLSEKSIDYIFADDKTKKKLKSQWAEIKNSKFQKTI